VKIDATFAAAEAKRLAAEIADLLADIAGQAYVEDVVLRRYTDKTENGRFVELNPEYAEEKQNAVGFKHPILVREGHLVRAVKKGKHKVHKGVVTITFTLPEYARDHDTGAGKLPVRRPVAPEGTDAKVLIDGIVRRLKGRK
jgi:hypothetical protein